MQLLSHHSGALRFRIRSPDYSEATILEGSCSGGLAHSPSVKAICLLSKVSDMCWRPSAHRLQWMTAVNITWNRGVTQPKLLTDKVIRYNEMVALNHWVSG